MSEPVKVFSMSRPSVYGYETLRVVLAAAYTRLEQELELLLRKLNDSTGQIARRNIYIDIAESLLSDPEYEMSGSDWDYEHPLHDKIKALKAERDAALKQVDGLRDKILELLTKE